LRNELLVIWTPVPASSKAVLPEFLAQLDHRPAHRLMALDLSVFAITKYRIA
jgi:hypothetical protein